MLMDQTKLKEGIEQAEDFVYNNNEIYDRKSFEEYVL